MQKCIGLLVVKNPDAATMRQVCWVPALGFAEGRGRRRGEGSAGTMEEVVMGSQLPASWDHDFI